jgi:hypothetical protein
MLIKKSSVQILEIVKDDDIDNDKTDQALKKAKDDVKNNKKNSNKFELDRDSVSE